MHGFKLWQLLRYIREELLVVLGTSSSEPVLPRLLMKLERLGCKKGVVGLVLPTGYSFNLDGTAIYLTLASMFIAAGLRHPPVVGADRRACSGSCCSRPRVQPVSPAAASSHWWPRCTVMPDLPVAGVALIVGIDRFMSEARALTSTISNAVACIVVVRSGRRPATTTCLSSELGQGLRARPKKRWKTART